MNLIKMKWSESGRGSVIFLCLELINYMDLNKPLIVSDLKSVVMKKLLISIPLQATVNVDNNNRLSHR